MSASTLGAPVRRVEDLRFVHGHGRHLRNHVVEGALAMVPVRAGIAHGRLNGVDTGEAVAMPGVIAVLTGEDLDLPAAPPGTRLAAPVFARPPMAIDRVRFPGEIVAVVVADTERRGVDAAVRVRPRIDPLPVVTDVEAAIRPGAPLLHEAAGSNVAVIDEPEPDPTLFDGADVVVDATIVNQRLAAVPLETNSALAVPDGDGLELWVGSQNVFAHRNVISRAIGLDRNRIRVQAPDVGGAFGAKFYVYPEQVLVAALALRLERPVRWHESRGDNLAAMTQGRAQRTTIELGATTDGRIVAIRTRVVQDVGAYPLFGAHLPTWTVQMTPGVYDVPRVEAGFRGVVTNTTPIHAYRGAGRPEATHAIERAIDVLAAELGLDPVEVRRRNLIPADAFPYVTATGAEYDSGDYATALQRALDTADQDALRTEQRRRRRGARSQLGIGVSCYVEVTPPGGWSEWSAVEIRPTGDVTVRVGTSAHGQGHETAFAQIASARLGIPIDRIDVVQADTDAIPRGAGTSGSRSLQLAGSGVLRAADEVLARARELVAGHLGLPEDGVAVTGDGVGPVGATGPSVTWGEVATLASDPDPGSPAHRRGLLAEVVFDQGRATYPFGAHVAVVEVDTETGEVRLLRHIACDDCGTIVNPLLVAGQVHGGVAQGVGQALCEGVIHGTDGRPLTGDLAGYTIPTAEMVPDVERIRTETPTPHNPLGAKGIGESATIGSTPAVHNAVVDALSHLGVRHLDMPLTPWRVWQAIVDARVPGGGVTAGRGASQPG